MGQAFYMRGPRTLRARIETRIARKRDNAFLTREFLDLGGERQVLRALRNLVAEGKLIRLGYGTYARAEPSSLTNQPMLAEDFSTITRQVLNKLNVPWEPTEWERAYNEGRSTQVPVNPAVRIEGRFSRQLRYRNIKLLVERG